jgi:putative nucleotidyltransferase with HDIG domain
LQQTLDLDLLIQRIMDEVNRAIDAEAQSVWLVEEAEQRISCRFANGPGAATVRTISVPLGEGIVGNTVSQREAILVNDVQRDHRHSRRADRTTGITTCSLISVPMVREGKAIGAIQAMNKRSGAAFTNDDVDLLRSIGDIAALAVENARLYAALQESYDTTLEALTAALDARDHETEGHSRRVVEYAACLAEQAGMARTDIQSLRRGALIHDIGKIAVPDAILRKPGPLTPEERRVMEEHPLTGHAMLRDIPHLQREIEVVLAHQERWDGTGYPFGLRGEQIPLAARVFAIVDTLDAITSDRPYRQRQSFVEAREIIALESGKQFDPLLVSAFLEVPVDEWEVIRQQVLSRRASAPPVASSKKNAA